MSNRGMFIDALDQVLSERLDMVLIPLQKSDKISPTYEEIKAETEEFLMTLPEEGRDKYRMGLDTLLNIPPNECAKTGPKAHSYND